MNFYRSKETGSIVGVVVNKGGVLSCDGVAMVEMKANTTDAATEKHVPVVSVEGNKVSVVVGSVEHPMTEEHLIQFVMIETNLGRQFKSLKPGERPAAEFLLLEGEKLVAAYEYCNLHGLWKAEV